MNAKRILTVVGARPQFVKAAAVSRAFARVNGVSEMLVHTGQHYDANMSKIFFEQLDIPAPTHHLGVGGGAHGEMTGRMLEALERIMLLEKPSAVLVYGDTNSTLAGALAAAKLLIPIIHVEAGLRSFDRRMPEEVNRVVTDHLSQLCLCPTRVAKENLAAEGIRSGVLTVGDVMYDATLFSRSRAKQISEQLLDKFGLSRGEYALCTVHRAENTDDEDQFRNVMLWLAQRAEQGKIIFPAHPRIRKMVSDWEAPGLQVIEPLGYFEIQSLLSNAAAVYTDSGGMQKEAYFHRVPCVTLRDNTEWVETIDAGWNRLWKTPDYVQPRREIDDYGDGDAAAACVQAIVKFLD